MTAQKQKIFNILSDGNWHCVNEFIDTYCVDYRRRLIDLKRDGYELENKKCERHNHIGGSKEWRLKPQKVSLGVPLPSLPIVERRVEELSVVKGQKSLFVN